jgi:hypothetical protein
MLGAKGSGTEKNARNGTETILIVLDLAIWQRNSMLPWKVPKHRKHQRAFSQRARAL